MTAGIRCCGFPLANEHRIADVAYRREAFQCLIEESAPRRKRNRAR